MRYFKIFIVAILAFFPFLTGAQEKPAVLEGKVIDADQK